MQQRGISGWIEQLPDKLHSPRIGTWDCNRYLLFIHIIFLLKCTLSCYYLPMINWSCWWNFLNGIFQLRTRWTTKLTHNIQLAILQTLTRVYRCEEWEISMSKHSRKLPQLNSITKTICWTIKCFSILRINPSTMTANWVGNVAELRLTGQYKSSGQIFSLKVQEQRPFWTIISWSSNQICIFYS